MPVLGKDVMPFAGAEAKACGLVEIDGDAASVLFRSGWEAGYSAGWDAAMDHVHNTVAALGRGQSIRAGDWATAPAAPVDCVGGCKCAT